jgi:uncharacterized protein YcfJ
MPICNAKADLTQKRRFKLKKAILVGLVLASTSIAAFADDDYDDRGRVISVTQQFQRVNNPRQECRTEIQRESYYEPRERSLGGAIIGGVAGGLLGHTVGRGNGKVAAAAVGAGIGAIVGDRVDNNGYQRGGYERVTEQPVQRCVSVDNWQQVPAGFLVNYEYNGRQYSTVTDRDPGKYIPLHVNVRPNGYVSDISYIQPNDDDGDRWGRRNGHHRQVWGDHEGREHGYW